MDDCIIEGIFTPEFVNYNAATWVYNRVFRDYICQKIGEGFSLAKVSALPGMPAASIIYKWRKENEDFRDAYEDAVLLRAELAAESLIDTSTVDDMDREELIREKLRDEKRKFHAEKFAPEKFGARIKHTGDDKQPIQMIINTGVPESKQLELNDKDTIEGEYDVKSN